MQQVRIDEMPDCQMVSSGVGMFGEEKPEAFGKWMSSQIKKPVSQRLSVLGSQRFSLALSL